MHPAAKITQKKLLLKFLPDHRSDIKSQLPAMEMSRTWAGPIQSSYRPLHYPQHQSKATAASLWSIQEGSLCKAPLPILTHPSPHLLFSCLLCQDPAPWLGQAARAQPILLCPHSQFPAANPLTRPQNPHGELQLFPLISYKASFSLAPIPKEGKKPSRIVSGSKYG